MQLNSARTSAKEEMPHDDTETPRATEFNTGYIAGLEEALRLMKLNYSLDYAPGQIMERIEQIKGETINDTTGFEQRFKDAERMLDGRLGNSPKAVQWACEEYVSAEDALPDTFDSEDYRLSKAVASLVHDLSEVTKERDGLRAEVEKVNKFRENLRRKFNVKSDTLSEAISYLESLKAKLNITEIERDEAKVATDFANLACEKLEARLQQAEAQAAELKDCLDGAFKSVKAYKPGPHMPGSPLARWEKALSSTDCGQSILARLEEARWLMTNMATWGTGPYVSKEWISRRDAWLSGHAPTITPGQYASMSRSELESALGQREEQLRVALQEIEQLNTKVKCTDH